MVLGMTKLFLLSQYPNFNNLLKYVDYKINIKNGYNYIVPEL